jgi:hypothetical protein
MLAGLAAGVDVVQLGEQISENYALVLAEAERQGGNSQGNQNGQGGNSQGGGNRPPVEPDEPKEPPVTPKPFPQHPLVTIDDKPSGTAVPIGKIVPLGFHADDGVFGAAVVDSLDDLQGYSTLFQTSGYTADFFTDNALILLSIRVGNENIDYQIDGLVRSGSNLSLDTTVVWLGGKDMRFKGSRRVALEVAKDDIAGVSGFRRYAFDVEDELVKQIPFTDWTLDHNFADDKVVIGIKRAQSTYHGLFIPGDFLGVGIDSIRDFDDSFFYNPSRNYQKYSQMLSLTLSTPGKQNVLDAISVLRVHELVLFADPNIGGTFG